RVVHGFGTDQPSSKGTRMKVTAAVVESPDARFQLEEVEIGQLRPDELLVRVVAVGMCHTDLSVRSQATPFPLPGVLGHEGAGVVEAVGEGVTTVKEGDHVVLTTLGNCGSCQYCDAGRPTMCRSTFGARPQPFTWRGEPAYSFANASVFSERTVVKANQAVPIPADVPLTAASLVGCGVLTGVGAVLQRAQVPTGASVVVIGVGGIGLNVIQGAALAGASRIIAVDTNTRKEEIALQFGATDFVDSTDGVRGVRKPGVDFAFECVGNVGLIRAAIDLLDWGGTCVMLGVPESTAEASFNVASMYLDKGVLGCRYGSSQPQRDVRRYVDLYRRGRLKLDELVSATYPLGDMKAAVHDLEAGELAARGVLTLR
ncbi:MAG TPA: alcohol dehydrogenase catalytic domain-containing protein, partial [Mycobacteriales bacterium]|nr:alcohol dehydrogenase catalytic domain-containing protein [Mycobacteriales bacterium]